jgi:xanthosine utilization system XapX-like protein
MVNVGEVCGILTSLVSAIATAVNAVPVVGGIAGVLVGLGIYGIARELEQKK